MDRKVAFKLGELFCGPGGIALGALKSSFEHGGTNYSFEHAWANDNDRDTCDTFIKNIAKGSPSTVYCEDVRQLNIKKLSPIDAFAFGFPCNDFSIVGEKKGFDGNFGPLYSYGVKVLDYFKPKVFFAENVGGLSSSNEGKAFETILDDLKSAGNGYDITAHVYRFEEYGIPQTRHRIIIVGIDQELGLSFKVPAPASRNKPVSARQAIENPPIPRTAPNQERTTQSETVIKRLQLIKPGQNAWNATLPKHLQLNVKGARLSQIYKRLDPDKPAYTITGSGGGGTHVYHWSEPRALTNRERARLQTFPDDFEFSGTKESVRRQIGMAVCPKMAQIIFTSILKTLAGADYPHVEPIFARQESLFAGLAE
ncbi:MAG: DNA cytosine methyltransferase [Nitrospinae bacterium]|nr:DNA cytosine methyltransferase [Nitrospinota bacterium]